jgi:hypothetical protein
MCLALPFALSLLALFDDASPKQTKDNYLRSVSINNDSGGFIMQTYISILLGE